MGRGPNWTSDEITILKAHYSIKERCEVEALLPNRGWKAIRHKAEKLRLFRPLNAVPNENLSVADLVYCAGLFDGEGSVFIRKRDVKSKYPSYYLEISVTNTHLPTIQWIKGLWGLGTVRLKKNKEEKAEIGIAIQEFKRQTAKIWGGRRPVTLIKEEQRLVKLLRGVL